MYNKVKVAFVKMNAEQNARIHYSDNPTNRPAAAIGELLLQIPSVLLAESHGHLEWQISRVSPAKQLILTRTRRHCFTNFPLGLELWKVRPSSLSLFANCGHSAGMMRRGNSDEVS